VQQVPKDRQNWVTNMLIPCFQAKYQNQHKNISKTSKPLMRSSKNGSSLHTCIQNGGKKFQDPEG
jgi:hypothetical protein